MFTVKKPDLSQDRLQELLAYDADTGVFTWRTGRQGVAKNQIVAGDVNKSGYRRISVDYRRYMAHVLAFLYMTGRFPVGEVDHINGDKCDNRWCNLRDVGRDLNCQNRRKARKDNKSGFLGVSPNRSRWSASIFTYGKKIHLGTFDSPKQAHEAYIQAKRTMHAGNTL